MCEQIVDEARSQALVRVIVEGAVGEVARPEVVRPHGACVVSAAKPSHRCLSKAIDSAICLVSFRWVLRNSSDLRMFSRRSARTERLEALRFVAAESSA